MIFVFVKRHAFHHCQHIGNQEEPDRKLMENVDNNHELKILNVMRGEFCEFKIGNLQLIMVNKDIIHADMN